MRSHLIFTYDFTSNRDHWQQPTSLFVHISSHSYIGNIGIPIECSFHIEVLFLVSIIWSCVWKLKFFFWTFKSLHVCVKFKHVTNVNMSIPKPTFEGDFSSVLVSYVCTGVHFWHFREQKGRFLHIASFIMRKAY